MSRSRKKFPRSFLTRPGLMSWWKSQCSRKIRRAKPQDEIPDGATYRRLSGDPWDSPADGKYYDDGPRRLRK